ncbi:nuclear transport factor 2 family protein [Flagellimonas hymeniacidonis]|uniref:Nuclear transport factor 2 family protein n=1 Tax=Flagellimonas hymeniacidonis TaxID=2603628 RepID=A0A5C8V8Y3_9FLAO|nr:nuclear transport factor 2 family protein [Flagellimonas hymeniacidonis]TXN37846.1 nuclear transport factor 2 family protein [Flagellimonas hymeniacidonis]
MEEHRIAVTEAVTKFIKAGDESNLKGLKEVLHADYRNVQFGFFNKTGVFVFNKAHYLQLIQDRTFGGIPRSMEIERLDIHLNIAVAKVRLESEKLKFQSYISLIYDSGEWKVIENFPHVEYKSLCD